MYLSVSSSHIHGVCFANHWYLSEKNVYSFKFLAFSFLGEYKQNYDIDEKWRNFGNWHQLAHEFPADRDGCGLLNHILEIFNAPLN